MSVIEVEIVQFPETPVAVAEHRGPPGEEYLTSRRLIEWRIERGISPAAAKTFGIHYTNPASIDPDQHRVDFCVSFDAPIPSNTQGVIRKVIPDCRCARARHIGSRSHNRAAEGLHKYWLPNSGERLGDFPLFFHYVNVGPDVREEDMITNVYLPLSDKA